MNTRLFTLFCCTVFYFSASAQESSDSDTTELPKLTLRSYGLQAASKEIPASVAVVSRSLIDRTADASFLDAMNSIAGVKMDERSPGSVRLSIRGNLLRSPFGVRNVKVYWDGIPFTDANGNTYLNQIGFDQVGQMEILKGPGGSMYGAGTGGVLLISSRSIPENKTGIQLQHNMGSNGLSFTAGRFTYARENTKNSFSFSHQQSDGYRKQSALKRDVAHYHGSFDVNKKQSVSTNVFYSDLYYQTPGGLTAAEVLADPRQARPGAESKKAALYLKTLYSSLGTEVKLSNKLVQTSGFYLSHTDFKNPTTRNYELKTELGGGGRTQFQYQHKIWQLIGGGEFQYTFNNTGTYGNRDGDRDTLQYQDEIRSRVWSAFVQATADIKRVKITGGLSFNNYYYGLTRVSVPGSPPESSNFKPRVIPRLAILYRLSKQYHLFASVGNGFSPPSIDEVHASNGVFNSTLRADEGRSYEVGLKGNSLDNRWWGNIAGYYFRLNQTIVSRRDSTGGEYFVNAGRTDQYGLEATVQYKLIPKPMGIWKEINLSAAITLLHARFKNFTQLQNKFDGNRLTGTPAQMITVAADGYFSGNFYFQTSYSYTGSIPLNDANTVIAKHYNQLFARVGYTIGNLSRASLSIFVAYEKSFNTPYSLGPDLNAAVNRYYNPAAPRRYMLGIKLNRFW